MGRVLPFFLNQGFDPEAVTAMGDAYDRACIELDDRGQPEVVCEVIAKRIIKAAKHGERDPERLCDIALRAMGL